MSCPLRLQYEVLQYGFQCFVICEISMLFGWEKHSSLLVVSTMRKICVDIQDGLQMWSSKRKKRNNVTCEIWCRKKNIQTWYEWNFTISHVYKMPSPHKLIVIGEHKSYDYNTALNYKSIKMLNRKEQKYFIVIEL